MAEGGKQESRMDFEELLANNIRNVAASVQSEENCSYDAACIVAKRYIMDEWRKSARIAKRIAAGAAFVTGSVALASAVSGALGGTLIFGAITFNAISYFRKSRLLEEFDSSEVSNTHPTRRFVYKAVQQKIDKRYGAKAENAQFKLGG